MSEEEIQIAIKAYIEEHLKIELKVRQHIGNGAELDVALKLGTSIISNSTVDINES